MSKRRKKNKKKIKNKVVLETSVKESIIIQKYKKFILYLPILILLITGSLYLFLSRTSRVNRINDLNILLITIDTLRADRLGYSGFDIETPNIDSLAYKGVRFMNAVCQVPLTLPSHASIFTGTNPPFHGIKVNGSYYLKDEFITLPEVLKKRNYRTAAFIGSFSVDSRFGLNQGFDIYDDKFETKELRKELSSERKAKEVFFCFKEWFLRNYNNKFFIWVHFFDPHTPYSPPTPFNRKYKGRLYEGEIAYTDLYVGKIIKLLKEKVKEPLLF